MLLNCFLELQQSFSLCIYILRVWACFLQSGLSFLEKKVWPSRLTLHTWREHSGHSSHSTQWTHKQSQLSLNTHLLSTRSRCRARCRPGPPETCLLLLSGNHNHGSPSQTDCSNLNTIKTIKTSTQRQFNYQLFLLESLSSWLLLSTQIKNESG